MDVYHSQSQAVKTLQLEPRNKQASQRITVDFLYLEINFKVLDFLISDVKGGERVTPSHNLVQIYQKFPSGLFGKLNIFGGMPFNGQ